jgi:hypothetical protein
VVTDDNRRHFFPDYRPAEEEVQEALAGLPEEAVWTFGAVALRQEWEPNRLPGNIHGRKARSWANLSERQRHRVSTNWAISIAARRLGITPRQWYEHGGDIRPIENRGYRRGYESFVARRSDEVTGYRRAPRRRAEMSARIRAAYETGAHKRRAS